MYDLNEYIWDRLLHSVAAGRCIPFLGAGASSPPVPAAHELASRLEDDIREAQPHIADVVVHTEP